MNSPTPIPYDSESRQATITHDAVEPPEGHPTRDSATSAVQCTCAWHVTRHWRFRRHKRPFLPLQRRWWGCCSFTGSTADTKR